jgi:hypothetical protein
MVLLCDLGQVKSHFGPDGDTINLDARYVHSCAKHTLGSEIILDTIDCTPR